MKEVFETNILNKISVYGGNKGPGNTTVRGGCLTLSVGRCGQLMKIGEFCFPFVESPDFSTFNDECLNQQTSNSGYVLKTREEKANCSDHLQVMVNKLTTSGFNIPVDVLVCKIIDLCCIIMQYCMKTT
ncbi:unnamed protein product [Heterobilharzia americana]|nr:unnamed protein product [Heterobilharzia americana]